MAIVVLIKVIDYTTINRTFFDSTPRKYNQKIRTRTHIHILLITRTFFINLSGYYGRIHYGHAGQFESIIMDADIIVITICLYSV